MFLELSKELLEDISKLSALEILLILPMNYLDIEKDHQMTLMPRKRKAVQWLLETLPPKKLQRFLMKPPPFMKLFLKLIKQNLRRTWLISTMLTLLLPKKLT